MQAADFPTVRFGAGPGRRSDSCDICMMRIDSYDRSAIHEGCQNAFHRDCFKHWAESQDRQERTTTCPMCRAQLNRPTFHRLQLTDYELEHNMPRIEVQRSRPSQRRSRHHSFQRNDHSPQQYESHHESHRDQRDHHEYHDYHDRRLEHRPQLTRESSFIQSGHRMRASDYSPEERMNYSFGGRESLYGGRDIPRSQAENRYGSSSGAGRGRLWEDIYELE